MGCERLPGWTVVAALALALCACGAIADCGTCDMPVPTGSCTMGSGDMACGPGGCPGAMPANGQDMCTWGDNTYLLSGNDLHRMGPDMQVEKSVDVSPMGDYSGATSVSAGTQGVYVLRGDKIMMYDHDLNAVRACPSPGSQAWRYERQALPAGQITLAFRPSPLKVGPSDMHIHVHQLSGAMDPTAAVTAYLYSKGSANAGVTLKLSHERPCCYFTTTQFAVCGTYELAVRVKRTGMNDALAYFPLQVSE